MQNLENKIFDSALDSHFEEVALEVFHYQYQQIPIYQAFCDFLKRSPKHVNTLDKIPFLPIQFFKQEKIQAKKYIKSEAVFTSSGTTGTATSKHHVAKLAVYEKSFLQNFTQFYGPVEDYVVLGLLPSYLEREGSSLIYMVNKMIEISRVHHSESGFFLHEHEYLANLLYALDGKKKIVLIGVSFGLLDFIEKHQFNLSSTVIMETGGMKGRRKEMIRDELHSVLKSGFGVSKIHSEYGMTELLSQAYSLGDGLFTTPSLMKVYIRNTEDPLEILPNHQNGGINIIDLSNLYSVSFIATQDLGKKVNSTDFEVVGRFDHSDVRGCNLLLL